MADHAKPPPRPPPHELPPGLLEEYLQSARSQLAVLATLAERLTVAGSDREALDALRREAHKINGSAGSYGFMEASRLAAGMEATVKDWVAHPDDADVDRGSLARWFVARLAEMLGLPLPSRPVAAPAAAVGKPAERPRMPRVGPPPRPPQGSVKKAPTPEGQPAKPPARPPQPQSSPSRPAPPPPRKPPAAPAPRPAHAAGPAPAPAATAAPAPAAASPPSPSPSPKEEGGALQVPEVIYVEDDASLAELLEYGLRAHGYRFAAFRNGREALTKLLALDVRGTHPLLLLDVDLPALDGYSIFDALQRERPGTYRVVFTTVHGTEEEQLRGLEAGALDYLVKPISLRVALEKIKRWVGR